MGPFRTSPLGLVPKPGSDEPRLIQDMSYPRNSTVQSVNAGIDSDDFPTEWGTFTKTAEMLLALPPGSMAATFDISAAYRLTPVCPAQQNALCVFWKGKVYIDRAVAFGLRSSAGVFGAVADMLVAIYQAHGYGPLHKWVDDFFAIRLPHQTWTVQDFIALTARLGVPWSLRKIRDLATRQRYIGFIWDLVRLVVALPEEKLAAVHTLVADWLVSDATFCAQEALRLHGKLVHVSSIFPLIRPFLPSVTRFASRFQSARARLHVPRSVAADLSWVAWILQQMPNETPLSFSEPLDWSWWGDASTSFGLGVTVGSFWGVWQWAPGFVVGPHNEFDIGWAEAIAVELGLRMALYHGLLENRITSRSKLLVRSDNMGVVSVINSGRSRSRNTNKVLKEIYGICAEQGIYLAAQYVPSRSNVTDALSRGDVKAFIDGFPSATTRTGMPLPSRLHDQLVSW